MVTLFQLLCDPFHHSDLGGARLMIGWGEAMSEGVEMWLNGGGRRPIRGVGT